jgi:hypothetical protein
VVIPFGKCSRGCPQPTKVFAGKRLRTAVSTSTSFAKRYHYRKMDRRRVLTFKEVVWQIGPVG